MRRKRKRVRVKKRFFLFTVCVMAVAVAVMLLTFRTGDERVGDKVQIEHRASNYRIMLAAKKYIRNKDLVYDASYFSGGYPPDEVGVCTDVVWQGFMGLNIPLKNLVDDDIAKHTEAYEDIIDEADPNIDFRYVPTLERFFERKAQVLTNDIYNILEWQPGDIVVFDSCHIAVVSDFKNLWGQPFIIQHGKDPAGDEDRIRAGGEMSVSGHFRWVPVE